MRDPVRRLRIGLACRFKMLPSVFDSVATNRDMIDILAYDLTQDEEWQKTEQREVEREQSRLMTAEEQRNHLISGLSNG